MRGLSGEEFDVVEAGSGRMELTIQIASLPDREQLVAEIWVGNLTAC
jgi:hypothetical protein